MEPLSATASIIAILQLSGKVLGYLNDVQSASKESRLFAIEMSNLYSLLLSLQFRLEDQGTGQPWCTALRALSVENGPLEQYRQALELLQDKIKQQGRPPKLGDVLAWKFKKEEVASTLDRIERLKSLIQIVLQIDDFKLSCAIKKDTDLIRTQISAIQPGINILKQDQEKLRHHEFLARLSQSDFPAQQSDIISRRQEGTGTWLLKSPEFLNWLQNSSTTLFCPGIPGAGKTMMAATAIEYLLASRENASIGIAYVYYNYKSQGEQDTSYMLAAILKQLIQGNPAAAKRAENLLSSPNGQKFTLSPDELSNALCDVLKCHSFSYIVVDALDECRDIDGTRRQFLAKLRGFQASTDVRLLVTSRYIPEVLDEFRDASRLEVRASDEDVRRFVAGQTFRLPKCIQRNPELQWTVQNRIVETVDGMFLLARLHTDSLMDKRTAKEVKLALTKLAQASTKLNNAYDEAIHRIESQLEGDRTLAKKVISWITHAKRPLTTIEICHALAVEPGESHLDPENIPDVDDLVSVCAGLVVVDEERDIIRLVHYTTQEYFERNIQSWDPDAQMRIATACLTYLSFDCFKSGSCASDELNERLWRYCLLFYTANHWGDHVKAVETEVCDLCFSFLLNPQLLGCAAQVGGPDRWEWPHDSQLCTPTPPLQYLTFFGLQKLSKKLLIDLGDNAVAAVNEHEHYKEAPLSIAVARADAGMTKFLLDEGAEVFHPREILHYLLEEASWFGYESIIEVLLEAGVHVNSNKEAYAEALQYSSGEGHEQIVRLLISAGIDVNACPSKSALTSASAGGHESILKMLIEAGIDLNPPPDYGEHNPALKTASIHGYDHITNLLLDSGAVWELRGKTFELPIYSRPPY